MRNTDQSDLYHLTGNIRCGIIGPCKFICKLLLWIGSALRRLLFSPECAKVVHQESIIWMAVHHGCVLTAITCAPSGWKEKFHNAMNLVIPEVDKGLFNSAICEGHSQWPRRFCQVGYHCGQAGREVEHHWAYRYHVAPMRQAHWKNRPRSVFCCHPRADGWWNQPVHLWLVILPGGAWTTIAQL